MAAKKKAKKKAVAKSPVKVSKATTNKVTKFLLMKANISAANKQLTEMKSEAHKLEGELLKAMQAGEQLGITVASGSIKIKEQDVFNAKDWKKIEKHIQDTGDFGIMQKRLSTALLKEYYEDGVKIKGVEHMVKSSLGVSHKK